MHETPSWTAPYRLAVALRLLRARKINLISIVGVMLGVGSIIVVMSVMDGFQMELREMIRGTLSDLIVEFDPALIDSSYDAIRKEVEGVPGVEAVALQLHTVGVIPGKHLGVDGGRQTHLAVRVVGIRPDEEAAVSQVLHHMEAAPGQPEDDPFDLRTETFVPEDRPRVAVSRWIARRLGQGLPLDVGDRFPLITFEEVGGNGGQTHYRASDRWAVISRIFSSGNTEFDKLHIYVDGRAKSTGAALFPSPDSMIAELRVKLRDFREAERVRGAIAEAVGRFDPNVAEYPRWYVETWEERQSNLLKAVNNEKFLLAFVLFFIVVVACFTIFATLTMTVVEKTRDIGVLRALGGTPGGILSIFMLNGTLVGVIGAALGYVCGTLVAHRVNPIRDFLRENFGWDIFPADIYLFKEIPTHIDHGAALSFAIGACASALVFAVIPAIRAARLRPVRALRYE
jgi:lipoprotein-releasing system permease protein